MANTSFSEAHHGGLRQHHHGWHPTKKPGAFTFVVESGVYFGIVEQQENRDVFDSGGMSATRNISLGFFISRGGNFA